MNSCLFLFIQIFKKGLLRQSVAKQLVTLDITSLPGKSYKVKTWEITAKGSRVAAGSLPVPDLPNPVAVANLIIE